MERYSVYSYEFGPTSLIIQPDRVPEPRYEVFLESQGSTLDQIISSPIYQNATGLELKSVSFSPDNYRFPPRCISLVISECNVPGPFVFPETITTLKLESMNLQFPLIFPPHLTHIELHMCILQELPTIPATVTHLTMNLMTIQGSEFMEHLPNLPPNLQVLTAQTNGLVDLPPLPPSLMELDVRENQLTQLPPLPPHIRYLNAHTNRLTQLPQLPDSLEYLNVYGNQLTRLTSIPPRVRIMDEFFMNNPWNPMWARIFNKQYELYQQLGWREEAEIERQTREYIAYEQRRAPIAQRGRNLAAANALRGTIQHPTGANWYYGQPTTRLTRAGPLANISKFLSGKNKTSHRQQKVQLQEEASRPISGGRRKTMRRRKNRKFS